MLAFLCNANVKSTISLEFQAAGHQTEGRMRAAGRVTGPVQSSGAAPAAGRAWAERGCFGDLVVTEGPSPASRRDAERTRPPGPRWSNRGYKGPCRLSLCHFTTRHRPAYCCGNLCPCHLVYNLGNISASRVQTYSYHFLSIPAYISLAK